MRRQQSLSVSTNKLGAPSEKPLSGSYQTKSGIIVKYDVLDIDNSAEQKQRITDALDDTKGTGFCFTTIMNSTYRYI